jgi:hypothetical protein
MGEAPYMSLCPRCGLNDKVRYSTASGGYWKCSKCHKEWDHNIMNVTEQALLAQRGTTHGDYAIMSLRIQDLKSVMRRGKNWDAMSAPQKEALELIATKIGRIIEGDPNFKE